MMVTKTKHTIRGCDKFGCGHFGASRGSRLHRGVDLVVAGGKDFATLCEGHVSKLGYVYKGDMRLRYVEITLPNKQRWRYHYIDPSVKMGQVVKTGQVIGKVQSLQEKYPGITDHVHFEVIDNGDYIDPTPMVETD